MPRVDQLLYVMRKIYRNVLETLQLCVLISKSIEWELAMSIRPRPMCP